MKVDRNQDLSPRTYMGYTFFKCGKIVNKKGLTLKPEIIISRSGKKYHRVSLHFKGYRYRLLVHRAMAMVFIGHVEGFEVIHEDKNTLNNDVFNLGIFTPSETHQLHWRKSNVNE